MIAADRYVALVAAYEDGSLNAAGRHDLTRILEEDPALREEFLLRYELHLQLAAHLGRDRGTGLADRVRQVAGGSTQTSRYRIADGAITRARRRRRRVAVLYAVAAVVLLTVGTGLWGRFVAVAPPDQVPGIAPAPRRLQLTAGEQREVHLAAGTMTVTGPAAMRIDENRVDITAGTYAIAIDRPPSVPPVHLSTPQATVVVTGTRLTVECHDEGTRVAVAEGSVRFTPTDDALCRPVAPGSIVAGEEVVALDRGWLAARTRALTTGPMAFDQPEVEYEEVADYAYRDGDWITLDANARQRAPAQGFCLRRPIDPAGGVVRLDLPRLAPWDVLFLPGSVWLLFEETAAGPSPDVVMELEGWLYDEPVPPKRWASSDTVHGDHAFRVVCRERGRFGDWFELVRSGQGVTEEHRLVFGAPETLVFDVVANDGGVTLGVRWVRVHTYRR